LLGSDTVVTRSAEVLVNPDPQPTGGNTEGTINAMLTQLFLKSTAPITLVGSFFDVFVVLDPAGPSTGLLSLVNTTGGEGSPTVPEGTFGPNSFFDFFVDINCAPAGSGITPVPCNPNSPRTEIRLSSLLGGWNDPDDGVGGFLAGQVTECNPGVTCHVANPAPEPNSLPLFAAMVGCVIGLNRLRKTRLRPRQS
jgi:hypothetical protein